MGKRISIVAVLLATSFLGSLLALVLLGRNPLVGSSPDASAGGPLRHGIEGSPVTMARRVHTPSTAAEPEAAAEAPETAVLPPGDVEATYGPGQVGEEAVGPLPPPDPVAQERGVIAGGEFGPSGFAGGSDRSSSRSTAGRVKGWGDSPSGGRPVLDASGPRSVGRRLPARDEGAAPGSAEGAPPGRRAEGGPPGRSATGGPPGPSEGRPLRKVALPGTAVGRS